MLTGILSLAGSVIAIATATLSYGMSRKAHSLSVRTANQQNRRGRSEETTRLLRWAVELATESDMRRGLAGVATLKALKDAHVMIREDRAFVNAVSAAVMEAATAYPAAAGFRTDTTTEGDQDAWNRLGHARSGRGSEARRRDRH
jgi:hypothetical protein